MTNKNLIVFLFCQSYGMKQIVTATEFWNIETFLRVTWKFNISVRNEVVYKKNVPRTSCSVFHKLSANQFSSGQS
jgi:hypothetical protein